MKVTRFLFAIGLAAIAVLGLLRLRFDVEVLNLLPSELPAVQGLRIHQEHFADARELIITIQGEDPDQAEVAAQTIAEQLRLATNLVSQVLWQPPWQEHPGQAAELIAWLWFNQPPETFAELTNRLAPGHLESTLAAARLTLTTSLSPADIARLSYDPLGLTQLPDRAAGAAPQFGEGQEVFSSADGTFRIVFVHANTTLSSYVESRRWFAAVRELVNQVRSLPDMPKVEIAYTGGPAFVAEISSSMQGDLTKSVGSTMVIIILLFWWAHRRLTPLLWLLVLLGATLAGTLAAGGLLLGTVNVVSIGFAAILLGLAVDYALVLYHEALDTPGAPVSAVRRTIAGSIIWSAVTTATAFSILNFGGLPGLAQLGSMVAIGVILAAIIMLSWYLPPLAGRLKRHPTASANRDIENAGSAGSSVAAWIVTAAVIATSIIVLALERPALDHSTNSLRPRQSGAYTAMQQIQSNLVARDEPDWLLVSGSNEAELAARLDAVKPVLSRALDKNEITRFSLPDALVPAIEHQRANRPVAAALANQRDHLERAAAAAGFTTDATVFTENILVMWQRAAESTPPFWPTNAMSEWILDKALARTTNGIFALGLVTSPTNHVAGSNSWTRDLPQEGVWLAGWQRIGSDLLDVVKRDFWRVILPVVLIVFVSLFLAFRRIHEVLLSFAVLLFTGLALSALMALAGWSWNLLNMLAVPLLLGVGVDYTIHMQLALRRHDGNVAAARRTTGRALLLCAGTTVAGFGSNALSNNAGLASLGLVCASGIAIAFVSAVFLLPAWWRSFARDRAQPGHSSAQRQTLSAPSSLYRPEFWRFGFFVVRLIPRFICVRLAQGFALAYWVFAKERRDVVIENLLPPCNGHRAAAIRTARSLYRQFAIKIIDLWRYEAGLPVLDLLGEGEGWEHFTRARAAGQGILLITPHLGNWEFGGPWLTRHGVTLHVVTLAEPGENFTELRKASRARWNIETLVVGNDPFAFLEIIKSLESGATVALLMDRPPAPTAITVELFGRPFPASVAVAELARATGCVVLPVVLPRVNNAYAAKILPPVAYDRASLRDRAARERFTQQIARAFEPAIREHLDQWYHFVPIWRPQPRRD